ncbi:putative Zona pellucida-like domain-containing protein 2 [Homarus americanus]|uniref:Putative Zona pellucida-like domain-containing protein 2 n=1 Tax=Homarus americanus TaxID=6706 RepID=A0A8J5JIQ1_HOMAM|nr:putative Zona pellucida-like domain-containing protein 2 [Homarus americanus]
MEERGRSSAGRRESASSAWVMVVVMISSALCMSVSLAAATQPNGHHTLFVTLPTPVEAVPTFHTVYDLQEDQEMTTDNPITSPVSREGHGAARSALLRLPPKETKMVFLADDFEAASLIPDLMTSVSERSGGLDDQALFPNTRSRPKNTAATTTTATDHDLRGPLDTTGRSGGVLEEYLDRSRGSESRNDIQTDLEVGSRHNPGLYRPSPYGLLPPRQPPRPRPAHFLPPGASIIDKEDPFFSLYSTRPGVLKRPHHNMTRVLNIEAECQDDFMRIHVQFNGSFSGLIYSSGYAYDGDCIYVNGSGRHSYDFFIQLNRCGTLSGNEKGREDIRGRTPSKNMMWNTLTVQYNPLIEEVWDEHFKVTCEYGYDFWKTVTFPFLDVEVQTGNPVVFTLTPPECHMEIRYGIGTTGSRVTGPVRVGDPLTLVIYMRSEFEGFDIVVSDCYAHNGGNKRIALIDHYGCPLDESLISHFEGARTAEGVYETQVYAFMKTFRFTGSPALYIECDVRMCHGDCPTQPCHWRSTKKQRRSVEKEDLGGAHTNVSESLSLFQSIQVVRDTDNENVCLKNGTFSALAGMVAVVVGILTAACGVLCIRLRRAQKQEEAPAAPTTPFVSAHYRSDFVPPTKRRLE